MHASIEQLLSFRHHEPLADHVRAHIGRCEECLSRLAGLQSLGEAMRSLPEMTPGEEQWNRLSATLAPDGRSRPGDRSWLVAGVGLAAAAGVVVFLLAALRQDGTYPSHEPAHDELGEADTAALALLQAQSRRTEEFLRRLPGPGAVVRVGTAATIDELQQGIALVDYQLSHGAELGLTTRESRRLWQQRVDLLNSLAQLRYVEAQGVSFEPRQAHRELNETGEYR